MDPKNLLAGPGLSAGPAATYLPAEPEADEALRSGQDPTDVAARFPACSAAWAALAKRAFGDGEAVAAYAYARTGYHRGLDQLRRAGWRGNGPVPWSHEPNRGFLRSLHMLGTAAAAIGEDDEAARCRQFLGDSSPEAVLALGDDAVLSRGASPRNRPHALRARGGTSPTVLARGAALRNPPMRSRPRGGTSPRHRRSRGPSGPARWPVTIVSP